MILAFCDRQRSSIGNRLRCDLFDYEISWLPGNGLDDLCGVKRLSWIGRHRHDGFCRTRARASPFLTPHGVHAIDGISIDYAIWVHVAAGLCAVRAEV